HGECLGGHQSVSAGTRGNRREIQRDHGHPEAA
ncbi:MAG: hypothetical protein, partial [Olavius algarvensis Gamma 1 endosymbiont]